MDIFCKLCFMFVFVLWCRVCFLQPCGHLLGKVWSLGCHVCCVSCVVSLFPNVSCSTSGLRVRLAPWNSFKPSSKIFLLTVPRQYFVCGSSVLFMFCVCHAFASVQCCLCGHLLGKDWPLGSCLWCLNVFLSLSHVVSWVRCGTWLYRFLIFVAFLLCPIWFVHDWINNCVHGKVKSYM